MAELSVTGQTALVTGAASGIGRACALALARAGAQIIVNYLGSADRAKELADTIVRDGGAAVAQQADVSDKSAVERLFAAAIDRFGTIDILVANAGIQADAAAADMTAEQWRRVLDVNLTGQFFCAQAAIREFIRRGPRPSVSRALGKIICMSSVHQRIPWAFHANYAASKGGVALMMQSLAQEVAGSGIRVNAVAPGAIRTSINRPAWESEAALQQLFSLIPYGRIGEPEDIAQAVLWLASDASDYVVGTTLYVDGGMTLYPGFRGHG